MVAAGGTLLVIGFVAGVDVPDEGPPWPLNRAEVESFATGGLRAVRVDEVADATDPAVRRWVAEFVRPDGMPAGGSASERRQTRPAG
jgi:hypothetical protein